MAGEGREQGCQDDLHDQDKQRSQYDAAHGHECEKVLNLVADADGERHRQEADVEIAPAPWSKPKVVTRAKLLYEKAAWVPIVLRKERPGFVLNRLLAEAFGTVSGGVCSPAYLEKTIKNGLGLSWAFVWPFETIELNGHDRENFQDARGLAARLFQGFALAIATAGSRRERDLHANQCGPALQG